MSRGFVLRSLLYLTVAAGLIWVYALAFPEAFVRLPDGRAPEILGDWYTKRFNSYQHYIFRQDGTGEIRTVGRDTRPFTWGTDGQRLQLKYRSWKGWTVPEYDFALNGTQLDLEGRGPANNEKLERKAPAYLE